MIIKMDKLNFYGEKCIIVAEVGNFNTFGNNVIVGSSTEEKATSKIGNCCSIGNGVNIGKNVELGNNVTIGDNVIIPDGCRIGNNVTIETGVALGKITLFTQTAFYEEIRLLVPIMNFIRFNHRFLAKRHW